jgi:hypothetical protein
VTATALQTSPFRRSLTLWLVAAALIAGVGPSSAGAATPEQVQAAIEKAKKFIYSRQKPDGSWDDPAPPVKGHVQWGGRTALATYALLAGGESYQEPRVAKAIEWLIKADKMEGIYALGLRAQIWTYLPPSKQTRDLVKREFDLLIKAADNKGRFSYMADKSDKFFHNSTSQYGVLGLWAVARMGGEVPNAFWQACERGWVECQGDDGGWTYRSIKPSGANTARATMTAAGIASLFVTQDYLYANNGLRCTGNITNPAIEKGLNWMSRNFDPRGGGYLLYGIERIGVASGRKYFGPHDWYQAGADFLITSQSKATGGWGDEVNTSFGVLFLSRGSAPVAINKLEYTVLGTKGKDKGKELVGRWNQRPRDVANVVRFIGENLERELNWQVTSLSAGSAGDLQDAPILYISGEDVLEFSPEQKGKLRQYVVNGGLLLGHPDCGDRKFADSFRALCAELFPAYDFRTLGQNSVIFKEQQFPAAAWKRKPDVQAMSNGVRELALLLPDEDVGKSWQLRDDARRREHFELGADIFLYAVEKQGLRSKGDTHLVKKNDKLQPNRTVRLARLKYNGNWDPEPGGWGRLANVLHNTQKLTLQVETVTLDEAASPAKPGAGGAKAGLAPPNRTGAAPRTSAGAIPEVSAAPMPEVAAQAQQPAAAAPPAAPKPAATQAWEPPVPAVPVAKAGGPLAGFTVAHLTGTADFKLTDEAKSNLKAFVESGGTLIVDAAGGNAGFVDAAERELTAALAGTGAEPMQGEPMPPDADVYKLWRNPIAQFTYRRYAREHGVGRSTSPRVRGVKVGGRTAIFFSREDLSAGILGQPVDGVIGYAPDTATAVMTNLILHAAGETRDKPLPPATAPAAIKPAAPAQAGAPAAPAPGPAAPGSPPVAPPPGAK